MYRGRQKSWPELGGPLLPLPYLEFSQPRLQILGDPILQSLPSQAKKTASQRSLTIESVGFVLGLLYHVTGDHVEQARRDVQPPLQVVGRRRSTARTTAAGLEQPGQPGPELGQPQVGVQHGVGGRGDHGGGGHGQQRQQWLLQLLLVLEEAREALRGRHRRRRRRRGRRQVGKIWIDGKRVAALKMLEFATIRQNCDLITRLD